MKIVFAASEVAPFSKTGGLGDVAGALPDALARRGHEVLVVTPLYGQIDRKKHGIWPTSTRVFDMPVHERVLESGVRVVFLEHGHFFDRPGIYDEGGKEYDDNAHRFAFFSRRILPTADALGFGPVDILHLNDWQTGVAALELSRQRGLRPGFTKSVFTIHNLGYQGVFDKKVIDELGLGWDAFTPWGMEQYDRVNYLKAGVAFADWITTVSPTYAQEIQTPEHGFGLDGFIRSRSNRLVGILNGVDYGQWNPATDRNLPSRYGPDDLAGKAVCRRALCEELGIEDRPGSMLLGVVTRLAWQKGIDMIVDAIPALMERNVNLAILGSGEQHYVDRLEGAKRYHGKRIGLYVGYDNGLAHRIEAGADAFLMPSLYEPCGLNQMYSLKYGTVPIVRTTGGLVDTVVDATVPGGFGTGFRFQDPNAGALIDAVDRALRAFEHPARWREIQQAGMAQDFSWDAAAARCEAIYERA
ncbi:glycogen synthase GlgA [Vulgatibacter sp.]|uniref:glycogen synthase GlgA n=1 Tax=Vulgatibacter sp. TaxID=1971226 RepID=UPI00356590AB